MGGVGSALGSVFDPFASAIGGIASGLTGLAGQQQGIAGQQQGVAQNFGALGGYEGQVAGQINPTAMEQYQLGASGQLTPSQQAAVNQTLQQLNLGTMGSYANLGLGGSTMAQQDLGANQLQSLAQQQQFEALSEQLGLQGLGMGLGYLGAAQGAYGGESSALGGASSALGGAANALGGAGNLYTAQQGQYLNALSNAMTQAGAKGAGSGIGSALGDVGSLFGLGGGGGATGTFLTPGTDTALTTAATDIGTIF